MERNIKANCPCCLAYRDDIAYQNSGPIVRICHKNKYWEE